MLIIIIIIAACNKAVPRMLPVLGYSSQKRGKLESTIPRACMAPTAKEESFCLETNFEGSLAGWLAVDLEHGLSVWFWEGGCITGCVTDAQLYAIHA